jgi:thioredoxin-like negative regulator of GroEL
MTAANFEAVCAAHQNVAIHFWAEWNGVDPPFDRAIATLPPEILALVHFVSCHIEDPQNEPLWKRLSIATIPSLAIVVNGKPNGLIVGMRTSDELGRELVNWFSLPIAITTTKK